MSGRRRELFPRDWGLQIRMGIALVVSAAATAVLLGLLLWFAVAVEKGWAFVGFVAMFGLVGALTGRETHGDDALLEAERARSERARVRTEPIVQRLAPMADLPAPRVEIAYRDAPLSWTTSGPFRGARLVVTVGVVESLDDDELAAVFAHELSHLANGDARVMTLVAGPSTWITQGIRRMWREGDLKERAAAVVYGSYSGALALPGLLAARIVSRQRELAADRGAAILIGSSATLASALRRLAGELESIPRQDLRALGGGDLFYVLPSRGEARGIRRLWGTHPRLERRVERLEEMERDLQAARPTLIPSEAR